MTFIKECFILSDGFNRRFKVRMKIRILLQIGSLITLCFCKSSLALTTSLETNFWAMGQVMDRSCGLYLTCQKYLSEFSYHNFLQTDVVNVLIPGDTPPYNYGGTSFTGAAESISNSFVSFLAVIKGTQIGSYANGAISTAIGNTYAVFNQDGSLYTGGENSNFHVTVNGLWSDVNQIGFASYNLWIANPGIFDGWRTGDLSALIDGKTNYVEMQDPLNFTYSGVLDYSFSTPSHPFSWLVNSFMSSDFGFTDSGNTGAILAGLLFVDVKFTSPDGTYFSILNSDDPLLANYINSSPIGSGQTSIIDAPATLFLTIPMLFLLPRASKRWTDQGRTARHQITLMPFRAP